MHLASFLFNIRLDEHEGGWRMLIPRPLRDMGWLPKDKRGTVIVKPEPSGLSVWTELAFRLLFAQLPSEWNEPEDEPG